MYLSSTLFLKVKSIFLGAVDENIFCCIQITIMYLVIDISSLHRVNVEEQKGNIFKFCRLQQFFKRSSVLSYKIRALKYKPLSDCRSLLQTNYAPRIQTFYHERDITQITINNLNKQFTNLFPVTTT